MQWNELPSSRRKHFTPQSSLGQGLTPLEEQPRAPHLARRQQQPAEQPLIGGPELPGAAQPLIQSTYQALCQHSPAGVKQASWTGQIGNRADRPTWGIPPSSLMQYSSPFDRSAADQQSQVLRLSTSEVLLVPPPAELHHCFADRYVPRQVLTFHARLHRPHRQACLSGIYDKAPKTCGEPLSTSAKLLNHQVAAADSGRASKAGEQGFDT